MSNPESYLYEFSEFQLDAVRRLLLRRGEPVPLTPKVYKLLPLSKNELLRRV